MNTVAHCALSIAGAAVLAACAAEPSQFGLADSMPQRSAIVTRSQRARSWMLPEAKGRDLLYVSTADYGIWVYAYPGGKLVGVIGQGDPYGLCSDAAGNVYEADFSGESGLVEYAHGGTQPIRVYYGLYSLPFAASSCAVDPSTGNLAATVADGSQVLVWTNASGSPTAYGTPHTITYFCTYDASGDLFVDQTTNGKGSSILELGKNPNSYKFIRIDRRIVSEGGLQWDGKYVTVGDQRTDVIYRVKVHGSVGTVVGTVNLKGSDFIRGYSLHDHALIGPDEGANKIEIFKYPAGGPYTKSFEYITAPLASTISMASRRR